MKFHKNFMGMGIFLLLNCFVSTKVYAIFEQRFVKAGNFTQMPAISLVQGTIENKIIQRDLLAPSGAMTLVAILEPTNVIEIQFNGWITRLQGFPTLEPELAFRINDDNNFKTLEIHDRGFRCPITSPCAPLINSTQEFVTGRAIWPKSFTVENKSLEPIVIEQKNRQGQVLLSALVQSSGGKATVARKPDPSNVCIEIRVGNASRVKLYSFKYDNPRLLFEQGPKGVIMKDGHYTYYVTGPCAPIITIP